MAKFYAHTDPAPTYLPPYIIEVTTGAWAYDSMADCLEAHHQFSANNIPHMMFVHP
jgi:hypothetical protein